MDQARRIFVLTKPLKAMNPTNKTAKQVQQAAAHINAGNLDAGIRILEAVKRACLNRLDQMYLDRLISELKKTA